MTRIITFRKNKQREFNYAIFVHKTAHRQKRNIICLYGESFRPVSFMRYRDDNKWGTLSLAFTREVNQTTLPVTNFSISSQHP